MLKATSILAGLITSSLAFAANPVKISNHRAGSEPVTITTSGEALRLTLRPLSCSEAPRTLEMSSAMKSLTIHVPGRSILEMETVREQASVFAQVELPGAVTAQYRVIYQDAEEGKAARLRLADLRLVDPKDAAEYNVVPSGDQALELLEAKPGVEAKAAAVSSLPAPQVTKPAAGEFLVVNRSNRAFRVDPVSADKGLERGMTASLERIGGPAGTPAPLSSAEPRTETVEPGHCLRLRFQDADSAHEPGLAPVAGVFRLSDGLGCAVDFCCIRLGFQPGPVAVLHLEDRSGAEAKGDSNAQAGPGAGAGVETKADPKDLQRSQQGVFLESGTTLYIH